MAFLLPTLEYIRLMKLILILLLGLIFTNGFTQVTTWNAPAGYASDKFYQVKVNGIQVPVFNTPIASYAVFDFSGAARVEVNTMFDVRWVDIRPMRAGLKPEYTSDNSFKFNLNNPENLSLELNGRIGQQPLFIFAGKPEGNTPVKEDKNVIWFDGGELYKDVKPELKDNQTVYIEGGAVVQGYIFAKGKKNIRICGRGILDGSFNKKTKGNNNRFISLTDCENISIEGINLHNGTTWQVALFHCNQVKINNIKIVSESGSDDGMDIFRCTNVVVEGVFAHTKDDCVAIKSGGNYPADQLTDNIRIQNCVFWNSIWGNAIEIGFELYSNEVRNIRFKNIQVVGGLLPFSVFHGFDQEKNVSGVKIENLTYLGKRLSDTENAKIRIQNTKELTIE